MSTKSEEASEAKEAAAEAEEANAATEDDGTQRVADEQGAAEAAAEDAAAGETDPVVALEKQVEELKKQLKEQMDARVRTLAEAENARRIARNDVEHARTYSIQKFAKDMLEVADNLQRALDSVPEDKLKDNDLLFQLYDGVQRTRRGLEKTFGSYGIEEFGQVGEKFDPNKHEAMFQMPPGDNMEPGTVGQVLKTGYLFKDRVLRPAQVGTTTDS